VTTRLWMTYTQTLLRRGAHANVGLARDLALDTIFYSQEMGPPPERACAGGRATAEHRQADDGLAAGDHRKGAGSAEAGAATRGGAMAEGARCCLAAMLLYDDAALLGSRFSADAFDSLGDAPGAETGASPNDNAAIDGGAVELAGEEGGSVHTSGRRCNGDGHLPCFHPGREVGAGEHAQDTGARLSVGAPGADDADALRRAARRERIREAETLLMRCRRFTVQNPLGLPAAARLRAESVSLVCAYCQCAHTGLCCVWKYANDCRHVDLQRLLS